jgi:hypothetical protein
VTGAAHGTAVVLSGAGRFADQWHSFGETSARLAAIAASEGFAAQPARSYDAPEHAEILRRAIRWLAGREM